jgi:translation elongation factor EF-G
VAPSNFDPFRVTAQLREKLKHNAVLMQIPIGLEADHEGVIDLIDMKARYFDGPNGDDLRVEEIPAALQAQAEEKRAEMLDAVSMYSDELMEAMLEEKGDARTDSCRSSQGNDLTRADSGLSRLGVQEQSNSAVA